MKNSLKWFLFLFCYAVLLVDVTFRYVPSVSDYIHLLFNWLVFPILSLIIIDNLNGLPLKKAMVILLVLAIGICTRVISNSNLLMVACFYICAFRDMNFDSLIRFSIAVRIILLLSLLILFSLGLTEVNEFVRDDGILRYSYGFGNINGFSSYVFSTIAQIIYIHRNNIRFFDFLIIAIGIVAIVFMTASRTQVFSLILLLICLLFAHFRRNTQKHRKPILKNKFIRFFAINSFLIMALLSLITYISYINGSQIAQSINEATSGRISSVKILVDMNGISTFGQELDRTSAVVGHERVLDNAYAYLLLYFGPVVVFYISSLFRKELKKLALDGDSSRVMLMMIFNVAALMEKFPFEIATNPFLFSFSNLLYGENVGQSIKRVNPC